jgi:hypothetical protein
VFVVSIANNVRCQNNFSFAFLVKLTNFKFVIETQLTENHDSVKKNESSDEKKKERNQMLTNQWEDLRDEEKQSWESRAEELSSQHQYKNNYHTEHRDKKSK